MKQRLMFTSLLAALSLGLDSTVVADDAAPAEQQPQWKGEIALGLSKTAGNSDTFQLNAAWKTSREAKNDILSFGAEAGYGEQKINGVDETTTQNARGYGEWKHLFDERLYGSLRLDAFHDDIADLQYRLVLSPSVGYYFIKKPETRLSGEVGPAFIYEKLGGDTSGYVTLRLSERLDHNFNKSWKVWEQVDYLPQVDDFGNYLLIAEVGTEAALNSRLSLRVVAQDKYDNEPAPGRDKNDFALITAVVYKY